MAVNTVRMNAIVNEVKKAGLDAVLIAPSSDLLFLIDHTPGMCERFQGLFVMPSGEYFYICNLLYADEMREALGPQAEIYGWFDGDGFVGTVKEVLGKKGLLGKKIGVSLSVRAFNTLEIAEAMDVTFVSARNLPYNARILKTDEELQGLRDAERITGEAFMATLPHIKAGMTEQEVKDILFANMTERGGVNLWALIASGPNGALPHYGRTDRKLQKGDAVVIDFGCTYNNLCSDCTRTVFMGQPTPKQREVYDLVLAAELAGCKAAQGGAWIPDIDKAARDIIDAAGYGKYFTTRLGHGIGYMGHEAPDIKQSNPMKLENRMAFSIEPGIYIPGEFGVRIEDIVFVNGQGETEVLCTVTKDMIVIDC